MTEIEIQISKVAENGELCDVCKNPAVVLVRVGGINYHTGQWFNLCEEDDSDEVAFRLYEGELKAWVSGAGDRAYKERQDSK